MKMSLSFLVLFLSALVLSGCATKCKTCTGSADYVAPQVVAAPAVVQASTPAAPAQPAEAAIPRAVMK